MQALATTLLPDPQDDATCVRLSILIAEDDDAARQALEKAVRLLGHAVRSARDGLEAWEMHQREPADVIVSDWQMPRMDGVELCRRTRVSADEGRYTYFILLTSFEDKEHFLRGMEAGADDYHTKPVDLDDLRGRLVSAGRVIALHRSLGEKNAVLQRDSQASFRAARMDALTQVSNRLSMDEDLSVLWSRVNRYGRGFSIAICDLDLFKSYNDRFGRLAGDDALRRVAQAIRAELRGGDGLYRYGGAELVALLPEHSLAEAASAMVRVRLAVERLGVSTISVGVAELDLLEDATPEVWLGRADTALRRAKASGRNRVEIDRRR